MPSCGVEDTRISKARAPGISEGLATYEPDLIKWPRSETEAVGAAKEILSEKYTLCTENSVLDSICSNT